MSLQPGPIHLLTDTLTPESVADAKRLNQTSHIASVSRRNSDKLKMLWLSAVLVLLLAAIPIVAVFAIYLPTAAQHNRFLASHVTMAMDQATFDGIEDQINVVWNQMNTAFNGYDYNTTYSSPWYWEQNYESSLAAQQDYFRQVTRRINSYPLAYQQMAQNNTNPILVEDWYYKSINNLRTEMRRKGVLDWATKGAWYLNCARVAHWLAWWLTPTEIALFLTLLAVLIWTATKRGWTRRKYQTSQQHAKTQSRNLQLPFRSLSYLLFLLLLFCLSCHVPSAFSS